MSPCRITRYSAKTRVRVLHQEVDRRFFDRVLKQAQEHLLDEPFAVDGTLSEAWPARKRTAAMMLLKRWKKRLPVCNLGADKAYETGDLV